eukprot:Hpha_TRINITY_DN34663_c0_g1::TRINITY_DN34663_c0_g1_i1::g.21138::m.21138
MPQVAAIHAGRQLARPATRRSLGSEFEIQVGTGHLSPNLLQELLVSFRGKPGVQLDRVVHRLWQSGVQLDSAHVCSILRLFRGSPEAAGRLRRGAVRYLRRCLERCGPPTEYNVAAALFGLGGVRLDTSA